MNITTALFAFLTSESSPLRELIDTRVYPGGRLPQMDNGITGTLPALTTTITPLAANITNNAGATCFRQRLVQIDVWANTFDTAQNVYDCLLSFIDGYRGMMGDLQIGGVFSRNTPPPAYIESVELWRMPASLLITINQ